MKKLVIDLGHGGYDPGAVGKGGTKESDVVLKIGKYLESMLKEVDLDVRFTRLSDKYVSLGDRVEFANNFGADYFYLFILILLVIVVLEVWKFGSIIIMISILMSFVVVCVMKFLVFLILEIGE